MPTIKIHKKSWIFIPVMFLLFSAPGAVDYVFHFPDEKYYTDAVLQMMDKNDYFTPYEADGTPRFKKPIFTYWVLTASYKIAGVSKISSRIFFWLAGAILVCIVFFMVKSLTKNRKVALVAGFVTAANPLVLMSSSRSIPDILLVLFLTISAWGFLEILNRENPGSRFYWMAWLGAAFAFETKGLPAAAFTGLNLFYILFNPWKRKKLRELIHPGALLTAFLIAISWFAIMYFRHGTVYLESFYSDQVGERVSSTINQVVTNTLLGIGNLIAFTIPWIFIAFARFKTTTQIVFNSDQKMKAFLGFIASWVVLIIIMSGAVFKFYDRYLLPVIPLVSFFFAWVFIQTDSRVQKKFIQLFLILAISTFAINFLYALFILPDLVLITGIGISLIFFLIYFSGKLKKLPAEIILANTILLLYFNVFVLLHPLLMPNQGEQLVKNLQTEMKTENEKVYVYGNIRTASNIRIHSHHQMKVISMDTIYTLPKEKTHLLVFSEKEKNFLNLKNYEMVEGSEEWKRVPTEKFPGFMQETVRKIKESGTRHYIAKPKLQP